MDNNVSKACATSEIHWDNCHRPFFNVYPVVLLALARTSLEILPSQIPKSIVNDLGSMCVKFPNPNPVKSLHGIEHFLINFSNELDGKQEKSYGFSWCTSEAYFHCGCAMDQIYDSLQTGGNVPMTPEEDGVTKLIGRIGLGVLLLASDEKNIKPILLSQDKGKPPTYQRIEKAKRRGLFGFDVGADFQMSPHFRRPHFAIRWTGKGSKIPKLVPVKGAMINKSKLEVPTGYEG